MNIMCNQNVVYVVGGGGFLVLRRRGRVNHNAFSVRSIKFGDEKLIQACFNSDKIVGFTE